MMYKKPDSSVLERYTQNQCTPEERQQVDGWYIQTATQNKIDYDTIDLERTAQQVDRHIAWHIRRHRSRNTYRWAVAAAILLLVSVSALLYRYYPDAPAEQLATYEPIAPGTNRATLEIAGNPAITLDSNQSGIIVRDGNIHYSDGTNILSSAGEADLQWATIRVPKGGQYQLTLQDGSKIWLNSDTELKYPIKFSADHRQVFLEGEGYFEIAHQTDPQGHLIPFRVESSRQHVDVLGTKFNISAYRGENTLTTLLQGSVSVFSPQQLTSKHLEPNQQSVISNNAFLIYAVDTESAVAWKNGYFLFEDEQLADIAKKIARWYDVEVTLEGVAGDRRIWGSVSKHEDVSVLMETLSMTGIFSYKIEGRRIRIMK